ncbi:prolyl oligopeptidase family serine peptidase [Dactylosporangium aurantiacum]|uniref:Prolyl oligopeptidase family serine peptidase n=1 Tax=Dactylosporangium aurantiacum TaxID=35754 RepID=A0A9Q9IA08_9ACTN|nr:prolyl oligopeptidase family serine peptidase [Dactylosporangium aurantiacum]MDG6103561.1 prolyl oligopeptidase family serine peptidase [Dactylosporangium aurantiacum]UWZ51946.1 prolyl oligopeptidase family serine peptidase [Dactylosporangium aurantiacum]
MRSVASLILAAGLLAAVPSPAAADPPVCGPPVASTTQPGYTVADPDCDVNGTPFVPVAGSSVWTGIDDGAAYRIERPAAWNGELVLYAHGYRGLGTTVYVDSPSLRAHYLARGFAWAASSYQTNGYDVGQGVRDTYELIRRFTERTGQPARAVYMTGASMGGHVTAVAIEEHPQAFVAAMPVCGVLGDAELFDYFLDANVTAAALTGTTITFPQAPVDPSFQEVYRQQVAQQVPLLGQGAGLTPLGRRWGDFVEQRSGGTRPGFDNALAYWSALPGIPPLTSVPFLFGVYPGLSGGTAGVAEGNITSNRFTVYQGDDNPWLSRDELRLNRDVLRVDRTDRPSRDLSGVPRVDGRPRVPVLSMHTIGDLFVPLSMEQEYARRANLQGRGKLFVSRAVRALGHCEFTGPELAQGFDDLVTWVRTGHRPAGDPILDRRAVAGAQFGCRFTLTDRPAFGPACPR